MSHTHTRPLDSIARRMALSLITFYQAKISAHKGFSCAHRVLHGGASCSHYIKGCIETHGLIQSLPLIQERFEDCKVANQLLKNRQKRHSCRRDVLRFQTPEQRLNLAFNPTLNSVFNQASEENGNPFGGPELGQDNGAQDVEEGDSPPNQASPARANNSCMDTACASPDCASGCDGLNCLSDCQIFPSHNCDGSGIHCGLSDCSFLDCSALHCDSLDCGSPGSGLDCSGLDCSGLDCGSCSW